MGWVQAGCGFVEEPERWQGSILGKDSVGCRFCGLELSAMQVAMGAAVEHEKVCPGDKSPAELRDARLRRMGVT